MDSFNNPDKLSAKYGIKKLIEKLNKYIKIAGRFAGEHKQIVKVSGMATGIMICCLILAIFFTPGYEVYIGGEKVAVVADKTIFEQSFENANSEIVAIAGKGFGISKVPKYIFTIAPKSQLTTNEEIRDNVMAQSDAVSSIYFISVDGKEVASAATKEEAQALLMRATSIYSGDNKEILNKVEIINRYEAVRYLTNEDLAVENLIDVLNVKTETIETYEAELLFGRVETPTEEMYVSEEKTVTEGHNGVIAVTAKVTEINGTASQANIISNKVVKEPVSEVVLVGTAALPSVGTGVFQQPYFGTITSRFGARWGRTHTGTDISGTTGDSIKAADNGIVITAEYQDNGYGNIIIIDHQNGVHTWYAHLDSIDVKVGDVVQKGNVIGKLGNTGYSTGPHLHFEVRKDGTPVDPAKYLENLK